jgi:hypothetical protein
MIRFRFLDEAENGQMKGPGKGNSDEGRGDEDKIRVG